METPLGDVEIWSTDDPAADEVEKPLGRAPIANSRPMTQKWLVESIEAAFGTLQTLLKPNRLQGLAGALGADTRLASLARRGTRGRCVRRLGREALEVAPSMMRWMFR